VLFAVGGALGAGTQFALADVPGGLSPAAAQALNLMQQYLSGFAIAAGVAGLLIASGLAILRGRQLPAWVAWLGIVLAVISFAPVPNIGAALGGIWTLVVSILLYARAGKLASVSGSEAGDPVPATGR
jgi:thiosulfate reductase cytochrome b subunit